MYCILFDQYITAITSEPLKQVSNENVKRILMHDYSSVFFLFFFSKTIYVLMTIVRITTERPWHIADATTIL